MPKKDVNQLAKFIADQATGEIEKPNPDAGKNPKLVARARAGGLVGGKARAEKLTETERKKIAQKAARKRWSN